MRVILFSEVSHVRTVWRSKKFRCSVVRDTSLYIPYDEKLIILSPSG